MRTPPPKDTGDSAKPSTSQAADGFLTGQLFIYYLSRNHMNGWRSSHWVMGNSPMAVLKIYIIILNCLITPKNFLIMDRNFTIGEINFRTMVGNFLIMPKKLPIR